MKTLLVTSFHPLISRNILATPILSEIVDVYNIRTVILCPKKKEVFFRREFEREGVIVESFDTRLTWRDKLLRYLSLSSVDTKTLRIKRKTEMAGQGIVLSIFLANRFGKKLVRILSRYLTSTKNFESIFDKYSPDMVFSTDVQNENDIQLMMMAKKLGVQVISMVRSWDNLTSKGLIRHVPDILLVQNELALKEAVHFQDISSSIILIVGIPHYDLYIKNEISSDDAKKTLDVVADKLIFFAPTGDRYVEKNSVDRDILEILAENLPENTNLWVRLPPTDSASFDENENINNVFIERPSKGFEVLKNTELNRNDDEKLIKVIKASDVAVVGPSTLAIDFALFDKPIILIAFDGNEEKTYLNSIRRYYDYNHFRTLISCGGVKVVRSKNELISTVKEYLSNPRLQKLEREKIVEMFCYKRDGKSSERVVNAIVAYIV